MNTKHFGIIKTCSNRHAFNVHQVNEHGLMSPILWCQAGEFRLIPGAVIRNIIDNAEIYAKLDSGKTVNPRLIVVWDQGIPISNQAGRALVGE